MEISTNKFSKEKNNKAERVDKIKVLNLTNRIQNGFRVFLFVLLSNHRKLQVY